MKYPSLFQRIAQWLMVLALFSGGLAMAQSEPTMGQIYDTAKAGKLDQAQVMVQQVLIAHPKSAKAHYVRAELYARQGDLEHARESLATAEQLAPGLPSIKPESVQALRAQLAGKHTATSSNNAVSNDRAGGYSTAPVVHAAPPPAPASSSWGLPLLLAGVVIVAGYFLFRRRDPAPQASYGGQNSLAGPQTFGGGGTGYPQYPQGGGYPQAGGTGLGGRIVGGVATGLAVGAGVLAAEAIGRNLMGGHDANAATTNNNYGNNSNNDYQRYDNDTNQDMGGANFGANDASSWDDGGGSSGGGGGDWDN